jgi:hypothetical protein
VSRIEANHLETTSTQSLSENHSSPRKSWARLGTKALASALARTLAVAFPAFAYTVWIRYVTRDRPHLGGNWHWDENIAGICSGPG